MEKIKKKKKPLYYCKCCKRYFIIDDKGHKKVIRPKPLYTSTSSTSSIRM